MLRKLTVGSCFSGIGGLELGLERTGGFETKWQIENDEYASRALAKHWPNVRRYGDIKTINPSEIERVDLVCGGYPCQPFSIAGKQWGGQIQGICGLTYSRLFATYDPATHSWKMSQITFEWDSVKSSLTWPRSGLMRNGIVYQQRPLVPIISVTGFSCWPTPQASEGEFFDLHRPIKITKSGHLKINGAKSGIRGTARLSDYVWTQYGGPVNPAFTQWLMGFPKGWATNLDASETQSFRKSRRKSAA